MFSDPGLNCKQAGDGGEQEGESHLGRESCPKKPRQAFETNRFSYFSGLKAFQHMEPRMKVKTQESKQNDPAKSHLTARAGVCRNPLRWPFANKAYLEVDD